MMIEKLETIIDKKLRENPIIKKKKKETKKEKKYLLISTIHTLNNHLSL